MVGIIVGDFNICDSEGRFNVWNQTFTDGGPRRTAGLFHTSLRLLNPVKREGTPQPLGSYALCQGLIVFLSIYLWLKHEIFTATPMSRRTWRVGPSRVIAVRLDIKNQQLEETLANVFPAKCPNIPFFLPSVAAS